MKRILLIFAAAGLLATGCGGGSIPAEKLANTLGKLKANTAATPHTVKLDNTVNISAKGGGINEAVKAEGKYLILDLSECSVTDNTIDGESGFQGNDFLTGIILPKSLTEIGYAAFRECGSLTSVTIPGGVTNIGNRAFYGCGSLTSVTIPGSVTSIGGYAFSGCSGLTSVTIPNGVTSIGEEAFSGCGGLTSVTIPGSVTDIQGFAFVRCSGLTSVTIPGSVTSIEEEAFAGCSDLTSVTFASGSAIVSFNAFDSFDIPLIDAYRSGGAGTYTRVKGEEPWEGTWTKQ
jgi:hypothetical protein